MPLPPRLAPVLLIGPLALALLGAAPALSGPAASRAANGIEIDAAAQPPLLAIGQTVTVSGRAHEGALPSGGLALKLLSAHSATGSGRTISNTVTAADGSFSFAAIAPTRNTWLRVVPAGPATSPGALLPVVVNPRVALAARSLGPGRTRLSVRIVHTTEAPSRAAVAHWYAATGRRLEPVATTPLRELSPGIAYASATIDPPARRFLWRVCLNPSWEAAMGPPAAHGPCPGHPFTLASGAQAARTMQAARGAQAAQTRPRGRSRARAAFTRARAAFMFGGEAHGTPAPPFPSQAAIAAAERWLDGRAGATALAVVDSSGRLSGIRLRAHFETASVIKVMFLAAYLKRLEAAHRPLGDAGRALLYPMIHESNNEAASAVLGAVGERAVERVAAEAGMRDYAPGVGWWAFSQTSAADQAQLLWRLGEVIPHRYYSYARYLMSSIEPEQSWGFPPVARPGWQVYFKTGALPSRGLFNESARLERGGVAFSVAVLSDHDPSQAYGEETIAGVARALLGERVSMLDFAERAAAGQAQGLLVLHHGRGTDEQDLLRLAGLLDPEQQLHVVTPRAPLRVEGSPGFHWYLVPRVGYPDPDTFAAARTALAELHDELWERTGIGAERTVLGGFSMGCVMSYALGLDAQRPTPAGILGFSGFIPAVPGWEPDLDRRRGLPVLVSHGANDRVIPVEFGRAAAERLKDGGLAVEYMESQLGHQIDPAHLARARGWVAERLSSA